MVDVNTQDAAGRRADNSVVSRDAGGVQSLHRALSLLDALSENEDGLSLTALAKQVGLPPSSAHRLLTTLQRRHYVRFEPSGMMWRVGVKAFTVGAAFARTRDIAPLVLPYMRRLMESCGETVNLFVADNGQSICIAQVQSRQVIRAISRPGGGLPLVHCASGKAMLAYLPRSALDDLLVKYAEPLSAIRLRKIHADLRRVRAQGFALDDEEVAPGLRCLGAAIFDEHASALAALSIAGPTSRLTNERLPRLAEIVRATADAATREYGGRPPA